MEKSNYSINEIYQGGYSSLSPSYGDVFTGYRVSAENIGMSSDARTANVLKEISKNLSAGAKSVELTQVSPEVFDAVPKQQLKELHRLSKLTGVDISVHAPVLEPSGFDQQIIPGEIKQKGEEQPQDVFVINSDTGSINRIPLKDREFPGEGKTNVKKEIQKINEESWGQTIKTLSHYADMGEEAVSRYKDLKEMAEAEKIAGKDLVEAEKRAISSFNMGTNYINDSYRQLKELFETANKYGSESDKKILQKFKEEIEPKALEIQKNPGNTVQNVQKMKDIIEQGVEAFNKMKTHPQIYKPLNEFAKEKAVETFASVALNSYDKFKDKTPIISIENPPAGGAFSTGEELRELVEKSREKFVEKAMEKGMSKSEAKSQAEKILGVTWDVGHINMIRKYGYGDKDIIKKKKKVSPMVKHVHLSDNFGFEHTELPMGMGNVPIKEILENLDKEGYKGKKVIEALSWWQHFSEQGATPPLQPTLEALGSSTGVGSYWNQAPGFQQGYFSGYGQMLPSINYEVFGAGFSQLPTELGGQRPGGGSRMTGKPME